MKKTLITFLFLAAIAPVFAEVVFPPEWGGEFCPQQYIYINTEKSYKNANKAYWAQRKKTFDARLAQCNELSGKSQEACYNQIRKLEKKANAEQNQFIKLDIQEQKARNQLRSKTYQVFRYNL